MWGAIAAAAIPAIASYIGGQSANSANAAQAEANRNFQAGQTQAQMDFQERMRATQYQTTVSDLKQAGLNPMLAYTNGGAGTPSGASASGAQAQMENVLGKVGSSAREGFMAAQQYENMKMQNFAIEQQGEQSASQALLNKDQASKTRMETVSEMLKQPGFELSGQEKKALINSLNASARQSLATSAYTEATLPEAQATGAAYRNDKGDLISGETMKQIEKLTGSAKSAINAIRGR